MAKRCTLCGLTKENSEFRRKRNGLTSWCRGCLNTKALERYHADPEKAREYNRKWRAANPGHGRKRWLKWAYGLEWTDYETLLEKQGGGCAICGFKGKLNVDHDHDTGAIRGLLCQECNYGLGRFADDIFKLESAIFYLKTA